MVVSHSFSSGTKRKRRASQSALPSNAIAAKKPRRNSGTAKVVVPETQPSSSKGITIEAALSPQPLPHFHKKVPSPSRHSTPSVGKAAPSPLSTAMAKPQHKSLPPQKKILPKKITKPVVEDDEEEDDEEAEDSEENNEDEDEDENEENDEDDEDEFSDFHANNYINDDEKSE